MKIKLGLAIILAIVGIAIFDDAMALEYSSSAGVNFTINPSISVSVSGDLIIDELAPGSQSDSNIVTVNVSTNNVSGYNLSSTVGNNTDTSTVDNSLIHNTTNLVNDTVHSNVFTSLSTSDKLSTLTTPNTWGYSYSTDDSTSWSNYSGLPLYTNTGITLSEKYVPSNDDIGFKIAAYADNTQASGEYTNKINFIAIAFPNPMSLAESYAYFNKTMYKGYYTIQDMTPGICATTDEGSELQVIDVRDEEVYLIGKLKDGRCWLKDNLRLDIADAYVQANLTDETTNATNEALECLMNGGCSSPYATTAVANISSGFNSYAEPQINTNYIDRVSEDSYDQSGQWEVGVYYNYCAITAGSYCYDENSGTGDAEQSVCPANWRMFTGGLEGEDAVLYNHYNNYSLFRYALRVPRSGAYISNGIDSLGTYGFFVSSTYRTVHSRVILYIGSETIRLGLASTRDWGYPLRCIANNE